MLIVASVRTNEVARVTSGYVVGVAFDLHELGAAASTQTICFDPLSGGIEK